MKIKTFCGFCDEKLKGGGAKGGGGAYIKFEGFIKKPCWVFWQFGG